MDDVARYHRAKRCEKTWDGSTVFDPDYPIAVQCWDCGGTWFDGRAGARYHTPANEATCYHIQDHRRFMAVTRGV